MIITQRGDQALFFTQPDHAALAGALMALWRRDGLPGHPRHQELLLAIREHDNGWREADAAPRIDPASGRPLTFTRLSHEDRIGIWRRGVRRFAAQHPFAALLVLRHAIEIHRDNWNSASWKEFGEELAELEKDLHEAAGVAHSELRDDYRFLQLADTLSLGACGALGVHLSEGTLGGYRYQLELGRVRVVPFPFAGATTLHIAFRTLTRKSFDSAAGFAAELAVATWKRLPIHIEPMQRP